MKVKKLNDIKAIWHSSGSMADYQKFLAGLIRQSELRHAGNDKLLLSEIEASSDDYLISKWLWTFAIVGGPITFIAIPALLSGVGHVLPVVVMSRLWTLSKGAMAIIFVLFSLAVVASRQRK